MLFEEYFLLHFEQVLSNANGIFLLNDFVLAENGLFIVDWKEFCIVERGDKEELSEISISLIKSTSDP